MTTASQPLEALPAAAYGLVMLRDRLLKTVTPVVVHRAVLRDDRRSYRLAMCVLAGNEVWNVGFFGRRSTRNGFLGVLAFLVPLGLLQAWVSPDRRSAAALGCYTAHVLGYDVPWTYRLWRLNRLPPSRFTRPQR